jgi:molecular chaperone GrpE
VTTGKKEQAAQSIEVEGSEAPAPESKPGGKQGTKPGSRKSAAKGKKKKAEAEYGALQDRHLRLQADFENYRKRMVREKAELYRMANADLIDELLPVLDHFDLAMGATSEHEASDAVAEGVKLVREQLSKVLEKFGLSVIDAQGEAFDPNVHEAISQLPSPDVEANHVMEQVRRGYKIGDKLLRAAQVVVSSGPPADSSAVTEDKEA